eukprot:g11389.t1
MPIQIVNSGVKLGSDPNTSTKVVFRNESGVVCRLSNTLLPGQRKTKYLGHRGSVDASDGGTAASSASDRHPTLAVAHPGDAEGGNSSSPYDMTSVFGLKVLRLNAEELAAEEQTRGKHKGSAVQALVADTDGGQNGGKDKDGSNTSAAPGAESKDGADSFPPEVWMARAGGGMQKRLPAHATLVERVQRGNDLVKAVKAGRSFRKATVGSVKGALELGLWAANRPDEFVRTHKGFKHHASQPPPRSSSNSTDQAGMVAHKAHASGEIGGADSASHGNRVQIGSASSVGVGAAGSRENDRVRVLEVKLRDVEEKLARTPRKPAGGGDGGRQARQGRTTSDSISSTLGHGGGVGPGSREGGPASKSAATGVVPRIAGLAGVAAALTDGRKPQRPTSGQDSGAEGLEQGTSSAVAVAGDGRIGVSRHHSPPGGSHTARSAPATTRRGRSSRPRAHQSAMVSGSMSARRAAPGESAHSVAASVSAQEELKAATKAYLLRQVSLDNALSESMMEREFDWDADMRRMMNTVKIAAAGEGKRSFESVPKVMRRQVAAKQRSDEARNLQGSWFPSVMRRMLIMVRGNEGGEMPTCMAKLAAALHKVLVSGHTVTPYIFWSLVDASFTPEDHEIPASHKMILLCLSFVHQRPENYHRFLVDNGIKVPASLKQGLQGGHQKRAHRKGGSKKSPRGGSGLNRLTGGVGVEGGGDNHGGAADGRRSSNRSAMGGGFRYGGGGASTATLSDGGGSDDVDMSDTMSMFSVSTQLE